MRLGIGAAVLLMAFLATGTAQATAVGCPFSAANISHTPYNLEDGEWIPENFLAARQAQAQLALIYARAQSSLFNAQRVASLDIQKLIAAIDTDSENRKIWARIIAKIATGQGASDRYLREKSKNWLGFYVFTCKKLWKMWNTLIGDHGIAVREKAPSGNVWQFDNWQCNTR